MPIHRQKLSVATLVQPSFAKGEIAPALYGRVDTAAYQVALRKARNVIVHAQGSLSNRAGLRFIAPVKTHSIAPVLIPFQFKSSDTYVLEFGNLYMRVIRNDAQVTEATKTITAATKANPVVVTATAHGYTNGDHVFIESVAGMTELNGRWFQVANKAANTFELTSVYDGGSSNINGTGYTTYASGGTSAKVYEITTPYVTADLLELVWAQSADIITITHSSYSIRELSRTDHNAWTLTEATFAPGISAPTAVVVSREDAEDQSRSWKYAVTAIKADTFEESLLGLAAGQTTVGATAANPVSVEVTGHGFRTGDEIKITGFNEMTEVNDRRFIINVTNANNFTLNDEDGSGYAAETTGGSNTVFGTYGHVRGIGGTNPNNKIVWAAVSGAIKYSVYRGEEGSENFGFLGETAELEYTDFSGTGVGRNSTNLSVTPPQARNPFRVSGEYPAAVGYYQQRRVFGGSVDLPDTSDYSQTGNQDNFARSSPTQADDAIRATLSSRQVNQIRHYVPGKDLVVLTDGSEWRVNAGDNSGFSAVTLKQEPQTLWGANFLPPYVVGNIIMYCQENNITVRSLGYQLNADGYVGTDMALLAPHMFESTTIVSWGFARSPDPVFHVVRSDGKCAIMSFDADQEVVAWALWDTLGKFERCVAMRPSATSVNDAAYFVVRRVIDGNTVRYIERIASRRFEDVEDAFFVDSGVTLDLPLTISGIAGDYVKLTVTAHGLTKGDEVDIEGITWSASFDSVDNETTLTYINGGRFFIVEVNTNDFILASNEHGKHITAITKADPGVVTALAHGKSDGDFVMLHDILGMTQANDNHYKVANATTDTFSLQTAAGVDVDTSGFTTYTNGGRVYEVFTNSKVGTYIEGGNARKAVSVLSGFHHLEGETLVLLADGNTIPDKVVSGGVITLDSKASRVHGGLKFVSDVETLDIETDSDTIQGKRVKIPSVVIRFSKSRGLLVGPSSANLTEMKQRDEELMGRPTDLLTGDKRIPLEPEWKSNGRLFLRQNRPLPMTILAIIPDVAVGD